MRCPIAALETCLRTIAEPMWDVCSDCDAPELRSCPAVLFADQSKAFERVSLGWLRDVLHGWHLPHWTINAFLSMVLGRVVRQGNGGQRCPARMLYRGIGMGGTASLLLWAMAYDPVVFGMSRAVQVRSPTFVDDLAGLVVGPRHAAVAQAFLWAAGHCAGLLTESHTCGAVRIRADTALVRRMIEPLPLVISDTAHDECLVSGTQPSLLGRLVERI